jgi:hypothetical protein
VVEEGSSGRLMHADMWEDGSAPAMSHMLTSASCTHCPRQRLPCLGHGRPPSLGVCQLPRARQHTPTHSTQMSAGAKRAALHD